MSEYCTIGDLRDEGVEVTDLSATRATQLIREMSGWIERITGHFFDHRVGLTLTLDGSGNRRLHLPIFATAVTELRRLWYTSEPPETFVIDTSAWRLYNRTFPTDDRFNPKIELLGPTGDVLLDGGTSKFVKGPQAYQVDGDFGFVDDDPDSPGSYITPPPIKRACIIMCAANSGKLGDPDAFLARKNVDLTGMTVQGRTFSWGSPLSANTATGLPEADRILAFYRRPPYSEAA